MTQSTCCSLERSNVVVFLGNLCSAHAGGRLSSRSDYVTVHHFERWNGTILMVHAKAVMLFWWVVAVLVAERMNKASCLKDRVTRQSQRVPNALAWSTPPNDPQVTPNSALNAKTEREILREGSSKLRTSRESNNNFIFLCSNNRKTMFKHCGNVKDSRRHLFVAKRSSLW